MVLSLSELTMTHDSTPDPSWLVVREKGWQGKFQKVGLARETRKQLESCLLVACLTVSDWILFAYAITLGVRTTSVPLLAFQHQCEDGFCAPITYTHFSCCSEVDLPLPSTHACIMLGIL